MNPPKQLLVKLDVSDDKAYISKITNYIKEIIELNENIRLEPSSNPNEMVLKMKSVNEKITKNENESLVSFMKRVSFENYHRTILDSSNPLTVNFDVHMLVGDESLTQKSEIIELEKRLLDGKDLNLTKHKVNIDTLFQPSLLKSELFVRNHIVDATNLDGVITFTFNGHDKQLASRTQQVDVIQLDGYIIFTSKIKKWDFVIDDDEDLIKLTWERNNNIELVEFVLDDKDYLIGRVVHPAISMQAKEFMFCSYILACEANHVRHIMGL